MFIEGTQRAIIAGRMRRISIIDVTGKPAYGSLVRLTILMLAIVGLLSAATLWALRELQHQAAHAEAARSVLEQGRLITAYLARQPAVRSAGETDWNAFSRQVRALHTLEKGLQYVSVQRNGVTVYHEQLSRLGASTAEDQSLLSNVETEKVRMTKKVLDLGYGQVPVVVFATQHLSDDGQAVLVEAALRRDTLARHEKGAATAIASMFRVSVLTIVISFSVCAGLVVWLLHRETLREGQRRREEHLAFAGLLANGIVHDFRNPMSAARLDAQMLEKEAAKGTGARLDRVLDLATRIRTTIDRMDKVFQEFLCVSRPGSNVRSRVDLSQCVRECASLLGPRLEQSGLHLEIKAPEKGPIVEAEPASLQRALMNVITNAEQFSPSGGRICITVTSSGRTAALSIADDGPGIPAELRSRIFDMFFSTRPGGAGLGLFLAKAAIEKCGGSIDVADCPEKGACFHVTLPLAGTEDKHG